MTDSERIKDLEFLTKSLEWRIKNFEDGNPCYKPRDHFDCTPQQYHAGLDKLWEALQVSGVTEAETSDQDVWTLAVRAIERGSTSHPKEETPMSPAKEALDVVKSLPIQTADEERISMFHAGVDWLVDRLKHDGRWGPGTMDLLDRCRKEGKS